MSHPEPSSQSPWAIARRRFFRNIPATLALCYLVLNALVALLAYVIIPDNTQNANFQIVQLPKQEPGTKVTLLMQPLWPVPAQPGPLRVFFSGRPDASVPLPVRSHGPVEGQPLLHAYTDMRGQSDTLDIAEFLLPIDRLSPASLANKATYGASYRREAGKIIFQDQNGGQASCKEDSLIQAFENDHVVQRSFILGTDGAGRDVLSRLILGGRVTLGVGFMAVVVSLALGVLLGSLAGFFRGWVDTVVMWFTSVVWSIPTLMLAIALAFGLGKGTWQLFLAIGAGTWVEVARIVRGQIFSLREMQYIEAARALGFSSARTILKHVLPNVTGPLIIVAAANFAAAVLLESGLSFLGVGVQPPAPSWGGMIREGYTQVMFDSGAWLAIFPGLAIVLVVISLNLVGFGLRDAFDPIRKDA